MGSECRVPQSGESLETATAVLQVDATGCGRVRATKVVIEVPSGDAINLEFPGWREG